MSTNQEAFSDALTQAGYIVAVDEQDAGIRRIYRPDYLLVGMFVIRNDQFTYAELPKPEGGTRVFPFHPHLDPYLDTAAMHGHLRANPA